MRALSLAVLLTSTLSAAAAGAAEDAATEASSEETAEAGGEASEAKPSAEAVERAGHHFERGLQLYNDAEYRLALIEFERAYQLVPNYRVKYNIAQVSIQIGRYANALRALEDYLEEGGDKISAERRAQVESDLQMLAGRTARLTITSNVEGAEIMVDDTVVAKTPLTEKLLIDAGEHRLTVSHRGYQPRRQELTLAGGDDMELQLDLTPIKKEDPVVIVKQVPGQTKPRDRGVREDGFPYVAVGWTTTGALAIGAVVTGIVGLTAKDELDSLAGGAEPDQDSEQVRQEMDAAQKKARDWFLASDILTGAAVAAGVASLYFTLTYEGDSSETAANTESFSVTAGAGLNQVWVEGRF